jgi:hypothetical protein
MELRFTSPQRATSSAPTWVGIETRERFPQYDGGFTRSSEAHGRLIELQTTPGQRDAVAWDTARSWYDRVAYGPTQDVSPRIFHAPGWLAPAPAEAAIALRDAIIASGLLETDATAFDGSATPLGSTRIFVGFTDGRVATFTSPSDSVTREMAAVQQAIKNFDRLEKTEYSPPWG